MTRGELEQFRYRLAMAEGEVAQFVEDIDGSLTLDQSRAVGGHLQEIRRVASEMREAAYREGPSIERRAS